MHPPLLFRILLLISFYTEKDTLSLVITHKMTRRIIGIRHGEAWHNVLGDPGLVYEDTTLTIKGKRLTLELLRLQIST